MLETLRERPVNSQVVDVRWADESPLWEDVVGGSSTSSAYPRQLLENGVSKRVDDVHKKRRPCQPGRIVITARDCDGLLSYVTGIVAGLGKSIRRSCTETDPSSLEATLAFEVLVEDTTELRRILDRLRECEEVKSARRVGQSESSLYFPAPRTRAADPERLHKTSGQAKMIEIMSGGSPVITGISDGITVNIDADDFEENVSGGFRLAVSDLVENDQLGFMDERA
jgi:ACT domain